MPDTDNKERLVLSELTSLAELVDDNSLRVIDAAGFSHITIDVMEDLEKRVHELEKIVVELMRTPLESRNLDEIKKEFDRENVLFYS